MRFMEQRVEFDRATFWTLRDGEGASLVLVPTPVGATG
jgi:hypothetical protein